MKTTLGIPDSIFRRAKSVAAERGIPLREFVTEAVKDKLAANAKSDGKPWIKHMGKLKRLRKRRHASMPSSKRIQRRSIQRCGVDLGYQRLVRCCRPEYCAEYSALKSTPTKVPCTTQVF